MMVKRTIQQQYDHERLQAYRKMLDYDWREFKKIYGIIDGRIKVLRKMGKPVPDWYYTIRDIVRDREDFRRETCRVERPEAGLKEFCEDGQSRL